MKISLTFMMAVFIISCRKDDMVEQVPTIVEDTLDVIQQIPNNFYPLSVGSYWVYEFKSYNPDGSFTGGIDLDTVRILGDTIIEGLTYARFSANIPNNDVTYYQTLNVQGEVLSFFGSLVCPPNNLYNEQYNSHYGKYGQDTTYHYWDEFSGYKTITTVFGDFECIQITSYHDYWPSLGGLIVVDTSYFSSIGTLQKSSSYSTGAKSKGMLIDYHIE